MQFINLKNGMKVKIINWDKRPDHWNYSGKMDKWCGMEVTIRKIGLRIKIQEDIDDEGAIDGWSWRTDDFMTIEPWGITNEDWEI